MESISMVRYALEKLVDSEICNRAIEAIENEGFFVLESFVPRRSLNAFMPEVIRRFDRVSYNGTHGYVGIPRQKYLMLTLTVHPDILKIYTDPFLIECADRYIGEKSHLQDYRIYQNFPKLKMPWHVDNKQTNNDLSSTMLLNKGLIAIVYLDSPKNSPFQFVRKSHLWAAESNCEVWDKRVQEFEKDIVTFDDVPPGTLILYDFRGIHRAKPYSSGPPRTALFAQFAGESWPAGEPIFLETGSLIDLNQRQMEFLRFGREASAPVWPVPIDKAQNVYVGVLKSAIGG
jgi:hypothetical protein